MSRRSVLVIALFLAAACGDDASSTGALSEADADTSVRDAGNDGGPSDAAETTGDAAGDAGVDASNDAARDTDNTDVADLADTALPELYASTELVGDRLVMKTNLASSTADCPTVADVSCTDEDMDGLLDAWENQVLDLYRPLIRFDETEQLLDDPDFVLTQLGRVAPTDAGIVRIFIPILYTSDYGRCGVTAHNGDSERVVLELEPRDGGAHDMVMLRAYTAAHENTPTDHSEAYEASDFSALRFADDPVRGEPRWVVYASDGKHATYANIDVCENASGVPCVDEDCSAENVAMPADFERLPPIFNAGEPDAPLITDLTDLGFPGDDAWKDQDFCGGLGGAICSGAVRDKLLDNPFQN